MTLLAITNKQTAQPDVIQRLSISRRELLRLGVGAGILISAGGSAMGAANSSKPLLTKPIPRTGESLPVIGLGTWQTFDVGAAQSERAPLREVLREFARLGGTVIDSSPMYGRSEGVAGDLAAELKLHGKLFVATKVWTSGREAGIRQMEESFRRLRAKPIDLMQIHNLVDWRTHLTTLRGWKKERRVRYIGVTHYTASSYDQLARVLESEELDFVQLNYSIAEREAEQRLLPLAAERGVAVLVNRPFAQAQLFSKVRGKPLPAFAEEIGCASWAQFFLKFVVSHPAVTCAIPATSKVQHLTDNMQAGTGPLPAEKLRQRMATYVAEL
ncbi:MAG TPA: aldo/keto reductase [Candidatus Polarisedimenticolaceae bacterium]|nr:aldo/keto reductase [Candidatus Polarisedimenticolaceae bacterium]